MSEFGSQGAVQIGWERRDGEVDIQISTAKRYPRLDSEVTTKLMTRATATEEIAESCIYALPRDKKTIEGASIRFAELAISAWGNSRVRGRIVDGGVMDRENVTVEGAFWDLETNVIISKELKRRITDKNGRRYSADMISQTINAAISIAIRNAALAGIPTTLWEPIYKKAREVVAGDSTTMANRRAKAVEYLAKFGVREDMILATLEKKAVEDLDADDIVTLRAAARAIRDGEASVEDAFLDPKKPVTATAAATSGVAGLKGRLADAGGGEKGPEAASAPAQEEKKGEGVVEGPEVGIVPPAALEEGSPLFGAPGEKGKAKK